MTEFKDATAVKCINGTFIGKIEGNVSKYLGIPFVAEQPTGKNRWKPPVPFEVDNGTYTAYEYGKTPCQNVTGGDSNYAGGEQGEDCLTLNVFVNYTDKNIKKPVMVWVHGGAFECGGANQYDATPMVEANPDVIVVLLEYRLGIFGFFDIGSLPGGEEFTSTANLGFLDQVMALKWVHENIASFGGDPDNVTIFGQSAGGCSVAILALMEMAKGYFKRAIAQSGTPVFMRRKETAADQAKHIMKKLGCSNVEEMMRLSATEIVASTEAFDNMAVRDGVYFSEDPFDDYIKGRADGIDMMIGFVKDENRQFLCSMGGPDNFKSFFAPRTDPAIEHFSEEDRKSARDFLAERGNDGYAWERLYDQLAFNTPAAVLSDFHSVTGAKVYQYVFTQEAFKLKDLVAKGVDITKIEVFGPPDVDAPDMLASHGVEIAAIFNHREKNDEAFKFSEGFFKIIQRFWINFAKTGDPTIPASESPTGKEIVWPRYTKENPNIMILNEKLDMIKGWDDTPYVDKRLFYSYKYYAI